MNVPFYRKQMNAAGWREHDVVCLEDIPKILKTFEPMSWDRYTSLFSGRKPGWRQRPEQRQTRSIMMLPYAEARAGVPSCRVEPQVYVDLYSPESVMRATADLYRLSKAIAEPPATDPAFDWDADGALVVFTGMDAGAFTAAQRDELWDKYQVPVFEHLVGTDGRVIAAECEVHAGLHIRLEGAILETAGEELVMTSLSDVEAPAIRVRTGWRGLIEHDCCNCGRVEPRILTADCAVAPSVRTAAAN